MVWTSNDDVVDHCVPVLRRGLGGGGPAYCGAARDGEEEGVVGDEATVVHGG